MRKLFMTFLFILSITFSYLQTALATDVTTIDNGHWKYTLIESEQTTTVDTVIIYFHGSGNTGYRLRDLNNLMGEKAADGPTKYATTITEDWLPAGTVMVCPQAHDDSDFHSNTDEVLDLIELQQVTYPEAKIVLAGHSNGAIMIFNLAYNYGYDIADGWVFISGRSNTGNELDSSMENAMVVVGTGEASRRIGLNTRNDFDNLFYTELGTRECAWREEDTNNAYVVGDWTHGQTPRIFLEDFFWEWIKDV